MDLKLTCHCCGQHVVLDSSATIEAVPCPSCNANIPVPQLVGAGPPPVPGQQVAPAVTPAIVQAPPQKQRSIGWGVFWGLFGFFVILPITLFVVFGLGTGFLAAWGRAQNRAARIQDEGERSNVAATRAAALPTRISEAEYAKKFVLVYDFEARYFESVVDGKVPGVNFKLRNTGTNTLAMVKVVVYFKDADGKDIAEDYFYPVTEARLGGTPLKPNYVWQIERGKFFAAKSVPSEWKEGSADVDITALSFLR